MKKLALTLLAIASLAATANAQQNDARNMLGLERAVEIEGRNCLMTTPYDRYAICGVERVYVTPCAYAKFEGSQRVCTQPGLVQIKIR